MTAPTTGSSRNTKNNSRSKNMNRSETISALAKALASAQGEIENASKNMKNDHFKNRYADLAEVLNTVRPVFAKHGLAVTQFPSFEGGLVHVETMLTHESGEWMAGTASAPVSKQDAQGVGSAITYLRRYSLAAVAGVAQEDDDANAATAKKTEPKADPNRLADHIAAIDAAADMDALKVAFDDAIAYCRAAGDRLAEQAIVKAKNDRKAKVSA